MKDYKHIETMEDILNNHEKSIETLNEILKSTEKELKNYSKLVNYYFSKQWINDYNDDSKGLIPKNINRGVLSEDLIHNLIITYNETALQMIELGTKILKIK
ncbi:DUF4298 domain-containing protein [Mycoplasma phocoenae]|uniref:DUF4298 domain-containing protein n=1 Tax=Mycoplasma phocoenae TaxID=754517 RepID=A0A858U907_9MOLU|nr:DUF4298 domain-containing protein [Mycoplasma phocoenae]QJG67186.1 DUF4298 domain-containing protein [Mycoplasma phocoenae]